MEFKTLSLKKRIPGKMILKKFSSSSFCDIRILVEK